MTDALITFLFITVIGSVAIAIWWMAKKFTDYTRKLKARKL